MVRTLSNLRYTQFSPSCILHHVKSEPLYPKSLKPQALTTSLKPSICLRGLRAPPPPYLLPPKQNLIVVTIAQPREFKFFAQSPKFFPRLLPSICLWIPIKTYNSPPETQILLCNNRINKIFGISHNLRINFSSPQHC